MSDVALALRREAFERRVLRPVLIVLSAWEFTALATNRLPTITATVQAAHRHRYARVAVWMAFGWLCAHFFEAQ